ncbi:unnamed protein product [Phytophthora fragariaefolia]|uniref:Unnamed protein product n=1 Tax=Phytophthora fragariaefolia TaxID=1490495 RepID=A0A9W6XA67_9STRA|nr:unnamed protein product [Phytophthora fragariaefolia]
MLMKPSRKGLLTHIVKPEFGSVSDRTTVQRKTNDQMALAVIAGDVSLTYQVYILLPGVEASGESSLAHEKAFASNLASADSLGSVSTARNQGANQAECRKKKADDGRGEIARETPEFAFTATGAMEQSEWLVDFGASSHITSVRDKFVYMKVLKMPARIKIAGGTKIDAVATGTIGLMLMDGTTVTLSDVLYIPKVMGASSRYRSWPRRTSLRSSARTSVSFANAMQRSWRRNAVEMSTS